MPWTFAGVYPETGMPSIIEKKRLACVSFHFKNEAFFYAQKGDRKMIRKLMIVLCLTMLIVALTGCSSQTADLATVGLANDANLEITGESTGINLTASDMQAREQLSFESTNVDSNGNIAQVAVTGFSLGALLEENGIALSEIASLNLIASDGYIMSVPAEYYTDEDVFILLSYEGEALEYPRSCLPDQRAMYWVKDLIKIELVAGTPLGAESIVSQIDIFREGVTALEAQILNNRGFDVPAYSLKDYFEKYIGALPASPLKMIAMDGFEKTETADVFFENFVTYTAETGEEGDLPLYFSETISDGMRVKQLDFVISGNNAIYFGQEISVTDLFEAVGMGSADSYSFIASDGFETVVPFDAIEYGEVFVDADEGFMRASFDGYDWGDTKGGGKVKYLISIKAIGEVSTPETFSEESETQDAGQSAEETLLKCFIGENKSTISEADFLALPQIEKTLTKTNSKGETTTGNYKGVHWSEIAKFIGADLLSSIVLVASDGYEVTLTSDILNDEDSLFAYYHDGVNIESEGDGRIWFCASENFTANNWVKYVEKLVVE
jgi:hypothetical protein